MADSRFDVRPAGVRRPHQYIGSTATELETHHQSRPITAQSKTARPSRQPSVRPTSDPVDEQRHRQPSGHALPATTNPGRCLHRSQLANGRMRIAEASWSVPSSLANIRSSGSTQNSRSASLASAEATSGTIGTPRTLPLLESPRRRGRCSCAARGSPRRRSRRRAIARPAAHPSAARRTLLSATASRPSQNRRARSSIHTSSDEYASRSSDTRSRDPPRPPLDSTAGPTPSSPAGGCRGESPSAWQPCGSTRSARA